MQRSEAAKLRLSTDPLERSNMMASLARRKASKMTRAQRKAHALKMLKAKALKRKLVS